MNPHTTAHDKSGAGGMKTIMIIPVYIIYNQLHIINMNSHTTAHEKSDAGGDEAHDKCGAGGDEGAGVGDLAPAGLRVHK